MIALDAMGGDFAPEVTVRGAINVAKKGVPVGLFGDYALLYPLLNHYESKWQCLPLTLFPCTQTITMDEEPTRSVLKKRDASLVRAMQAVADGDAVAVVSAGNSGAALVAGSLIIKRSDGILRPALGAFLPTKKGSIFCIDVGANADCKPEYLEQFAYMGHVYVHKFHGVANPRVALLSNGAEAYKGSALVKQAYEKLEQNIAINFVGNLEARDIFDDRADVLVCDGFSGNILLKAVQGTASAMSWWIKAEASKSWMRSFFLACNAGLFRQLKTKTDYARSGGALLLGLSAPVIVAHGCSTVAAIEQALLFAHTVAEQKLVTSFNQEVNSLMHNNQSTMIYAQQQNRE